MADDDLTLDQTFVQVAHEEYLRTPATRGVDAMSARMHAALKLTLERLQLVPVADVYAAFGLTYRPWPYLGYGDSDKIPLGYLDNPMVDQTSVWAELDTAEPTPHELWRDALIMASNSIAVNSISPAISAPHLERAAHVYYALLAAGPPVDPEDAAENGPQE